MTTALEQFDAQQAAKDKIRASLTNLAIARQAEFEDAAQRVYLHLLGDLDASLVARACNVWALRPRAEFTSAMPSAADIRQTVSEIAQQDDLDASFKLVAPMPVEDDEGPRFFCLSCRDESNAWRPFWCPGVGSTRSMYRPDRSEGTIVECGKRKPHGPHQYVGRCECEPTNPVIAERRRLEVRRVAERAQRRAS